jgi:hypothetical protein
VPASLDEILFDRKEADMIIGNEKMLSVKAMARGTLLCTSVAVLTVLFGAAQWVRADDTNGFPDPAEVLQGRVFTNGFERDVFFLSQIRQKYSAYWPSLLTANITPGGYVVAPEKLRRFITEVGASAENSDDAFALAYIASVITNADFYTNASHAEVLRAVVSSLNKIGPKGRLALAGAFEQNHYRTDPESLEALADVIGKSGVSDPNISEALAATAFSFTAANGGSYPRCTKTAVVNLLSFANGAAILSPHLNTNEVFRDPGRFQAVVDGIAEAEAKSLVSRLEAMSRDVKTKISMQAPGANPYRDDLEDLEARLRRTIELLQRPDH